MMGYTGGGGEESGRGIGDTSGDWLPSPTDGAHCGMMGYTGGGGGVRRAVVA